MQWMHIGKKLPIYKPVACAIQKIEHSITFSGTAELGSIEKWIMRLTRRIQLKKEPEIFHLRKEVTNSQK